MISLDSSTVAALASDGMSVTETIVSFLEKALREGLVDAVVVPLITPGGDSYTYVLVRNSRLLKDADPIPPVIPVSGARALVGFARRGTAGMRVAAVMRPCEVRATIELAKLGQIDLKGITLISMDCPGAFPLQSYVKFPKEVREKFERILCTFDDEGVRPICRTCESSSALGGDIHFGFVGLDDHPYLLISRTSEGDSLLDRMGLIAHPDTSVWMHATEQLKSRRETERNGLLNKLSDEVLGTEKLLGAFADCINCHNCMRVCPICYCRVCAFDSQSGGHPADDYFQRAESKGGLRLPSDVLLFHLGRMAHMSLSCVSCGACEDACPASIPVAQIFSLVGKRVQKRFNYVPGMSLCDSIPLLICKKEEFGGSDRNG